MRSGVLFDLDGTLVDTNYLHTLAWSRALRDAGEWAPMHAIHRAVGMGADQMLPHLIGRVDQDIADRRAVHYATLLDDIRPFPGAADLVQACSSAGLATVLATSSPADEVDVCLERLGIRAILDGVITADDVETSKPEPDVLQVAVERAGIDPARCLLIGDSRWDIEAATRAGVGCVALECGGTSRDELERAGALVVHRDAGDLLACWRSSPLGDLAGR